MKSIEEPKEWRRKNRKMKGVNPLAMKKKKKKMSNIVDEATDQTKVTFHNCCNRLNYEYHYVHFLVKKVKIYGPNLIQKNLQD